jgi:hypothetical protein
MRYFKCKKVLLPAPEDTTLSIVTGPDEKANPVAEFEDYQYFIVDTQDDDFLAKQHEACEVEELTYEEAKPILKASAQYEAINQIVQTKIRKRYSAEDEIKLNRMANAVAKTQTPQEFWDYNDYVAECCAYGDNLKIAAGLKLQ